MRRAGPGERFPLPKVWIEVFELRLKDCSNGLGSRSKVLLIAGRAGGRAGGAAVAVVVATVWVAALRASSLLGVGGRLGEGERWGRVSSGDGSEERSVPDDGARSASVGGGLGLDRCVFLGAMGSNEQKRS